jgi:hypothetical protein
MAHASLTQVLRQDHVLSLGQTKDPSFSHRNSYAKLWQDHCIGLGVMRSKSVSQSKDLFIRSGFDEGDTAQIAAS